MKSLEKPKKAWGWVRIAALAVLLGIAAWTLLAAALRSAGAVAWMAWSGYPTFSLLDGLELAMIPLLAALVAGWLEEQAVRTETEHSNRREAERVAAEQQSARYKRFHAAVVAVLADAAHDAAHDAADIPGQAGPRIIEITRAALPELDGKRKGEMLLFLFEKGLLSGERPAVDLNGLDFREAALHKAQLMGICLKGVDLRKARMDGAHLAKGRLCGCNLRKAFLRHADLRGAVLTGSDLSGTRLDGANLEGADLREACLEAAFLRNTNLKNCLLTGDPGGDRDTLKGDGKDSLDLLGPAVLIDTILPDGRKVTNAKGKEYLRNKEIAVLIDRL